MLQRHGVPAPEGIVIDKTSLVEIDKAVYPVIIKAQVFLGGRGKAGLVRKARDRNEAVDHINQMIGKKHGPFTVQKVLVERAVEIKKEHYIAVTIDRLEHKPLIIVSRQGGIDIEEIAVKNKESILKFYLNPGDKIHEFTARKIASAIGIHGGSLDRAAKIVFNAYKIFCELDCKLVEINPLVLTVNDRMLAVDAKIDLDEDAMFRHPVFKEMGIFARHEIGELTEREKKAKELGIPYVDLEGGDIGVFPGGAGFGIAAIDLIQHYNGRPANFMDSGGAPTQEKLRAMLGLLIDNPNVKAIFGARFGGISRCDDWAKAVVQYVIENQPQKPMVMRMAGNMEEEGRKIFQQAIKDHPEFFKNIKIYAVNTPIEEVIKETIKIARSVPEQETKRDL